MRDFDVVVVGGGCAGLWSAAAAARSGARTLLVDKNTRIGERIACAEGVGTHGMARILDLKKEEIATTVQGVRLFSPDGTCTEIRKRDCGFIINKEVFLRGLAEIAAAKGVETWLCAEARDLEPLAGGGFKIDVKNSRSLDRLTCGAVVAADGIESRIGRRAGVSKALKIDQVFSCAQYTVSPVDVDPHVGEFHFGRDVAPGGYAWVFPKGESTANIGVGIVGTAQTKARPVECLISFKQRRCPGSKVIGFVVGGVPSVKEPYSESGGGVFLAGDAARVADPISGAGIVPGMESGDLSGRFAALYSMGEHGPGALQRDFMRRVRTLYRDRRVSFALRRVLARMSDKELSRALSLVGEYASRNERVTNDLIGVARFLVRSMPTTFRLLGEIVRISHARSL